MNFFKATRKLPLGVISIGRGQISKRHEWFDLLLSRNEQLSLLLDMARLQHKLERPEAKATIDEAIEGAEQAADCWVQANKLSGPTLVNDPFGRDMPRGIDGITYRFAAAAVVGLLRRKKLSAKLLRAIPKTSSFKESAVFLDWHSWIYTDAGLVELLETGKRAKSWERVLNFSVERFGSPIIKENFEAHATLMVHCQKGEWSQAIDDVHQCAELYERRPWATGDSIWFDAWELPNPQFGGIDLRLAAIINSCFRNQKALAELKTQHRWD